MKCVTTCLFISQLRAANVKFRSDELPQLEDLCATEETELKSND